MACSTVALLWLGTTYQGKDTQSADNLAKTTNLITYKNKKNKKEEETKPISQIMVLFM